MAAVLTLGESCLSSEASVSCDDFEAIVDSADAAIQFAAERGVGDPDRAGVGGHSYGAFMTANLLAHSDLFRAGIARSGAYNRTLTPFGFQSERRKLWDAKSVYFGISPFMFAHQINEPILLVHGEKDNNSGTFPLQSRRMYQAVKGNGGTVRLCMLPGESHGYRARTAHEARRQRIPIDISHVEFVSRFVVIGSDVDPVDQGVVVLSAEYVVRAVRIATRWPAK